MDHGKYTCIWNVVIESNFLARDKLPPYSSTLLGVTSFDGTQSDCTTFRKTRESMTGIPLRTLRYLRKLG